MSLFRLEGRFVDNLTKIYAYYTGGFLLFVILMAILERMGLSADAIGRFAPFDA